MKKELLAGSLILIFIIINSVFVSAITGKMGNARMILYPEVNGWTYTTIDKTILVENANNIPINIKLETDEEGKEFLEIIDEEFTLEPGAEKKAKFVVKVKKEGEYNGRINVFFSSPETNDPGVVLSSSISVIAKKDQNYQEFNEEDENEDDKVNIITGGAIGDENKKQFGLILLSISSFVLLIILGALYYLMNYKEKTRGGKRNE